MRSSIPAFGSLLALLLLLVVHVGAAHAKAPGRTDPEKLATKLDKAMDNRQWDEAVDLCQQGLEVTAKGSEWDQRWGEELGVDKRLMWERSLRAAFETTIEYGNRKRDRDAQIAALEMVGLYLTRWPDHTNSYEMRFQKAEVAWTVREYRAAAESYEAVYKANPNSGRRRHEAAAGWVGALWIDAGDDWEFFDGQAAQERIDRLDYTDLIARHQPIPLRDGEIELIEAMDAFVASRPDHPKASEVLYRTIHMHHARYQAKDGVPRCIAFLQGFRDHDHADWVARMLLDLATWSERSSEVQLRVRAMGLSWEDLQEQVKGVTGDPPAPLEPERLELFPLEY